MTYKSNAHNYVKRQLSILLNKTDILVPVKENILEETFTFLLVVLLRLPPSPRTYRRTTRFINICPLYRKEKN
jgi:hypothetical protein